MDAPATPTSLAPSAPLELVVTKADLAAARARNKQKRREDFANWTPNESTSYREMEMSLRSAQAARVFHLGLVHAQVSLYKFYEALPKHQDAVRTAEATINKKFELIQNRLDERLELLKATAKAVMADDAGFTEPQTFKVRMFTLEAVRFAEMLQKFDEINAHCHALYWAGKMNRENRANIAIEFRNLLMRFTREIHVLYLQAKRSVITFRLERERSRILKEKRKALTAKIARDAELATAADAAPSASVADTPDVIAAETPARPKRTRKPNGAAAPSEAVA